MFFLIADLIAVGGTPTAAGKLNLSLGILYPGQEGIVKQSAFYNDLVLPGRKLLGEPENFDY